MAKYDVRYSCGHTGVVQLYGPTKDRESRIEWMQRAQVCPACYEEQKRREDEEMGF